MDGVGVVQTACYRTGYILDTNTVCSVCTVCTVGSVLAVLDDEGMRACSVSDGHLSAIGSWRSGHNRRDTVLTIGAVSSGRTLLAGRALLASGTRRTLGTLLTVAQHIGLHVTVGHRQHQHKACVGGCHRDGRYIVGAARIQGIRHAQQLLYTLDTIVDTTRRVNLRLQIERALSPGNLGEVLAGVATAHLHSKQAIDIGGSVVRLRIDGSTRGAALQDGYPYRDILIGHQSVVATADHRLV